MHQNLVTITEKTEKIQKLIIEKHQNLKMENQIIIPIISNGDAYGALVMFSEKENEDISENDIKLCRLSANVIARYFE